MLSVLMSVYEKEKPEHLRMAVDSILNQSLLADEILLIQDGPIPDALKQAINDYATQYPTVFKTFERPANEGLGITLAIGVEMCKNDLIARMDTDDIARSDRFEKQVKYMQSHPDVDLVGSTVLAFNRHPDELVGRRMVPEHAEAIRKYGRRRCPVNHPTVMYRRSAVIKAGNYQKLHKYGTLDDYYLWMRMLNQNMKFHNIQEPLVYQRVGNDLISRRHGLKYLRAEITCFHKGYEMGYIHPSDFLSACVCRSFVRLVPKCITRMVYDRILHK